MSSTSCRSSRSCIERSRATLDGALKSPWGASLPVAPGSGNYADESARPVVSVVIQDYDDPSQWDRALIETEFLQKFLTSIPGVTDPAVVRTREELVRAAQKAGREAFQQKLGYLRDVETRVGAQNLAEQALSHVTLGVIDEKWKDHLYDLDQLREGIYYRAWGQKDPLVEYKQDAYEMFVGLMHDLQTTFAERWLL